jgi:beta-lactam-binding protein with PASTA domain
MVKNIIPKNWFLRLVLKGIAVLILLFLATVLFLTLITRHNRELAVPDFSGLTLEDAAKEAGKANLRLDVTDSIFIPGMQRGIVLRQNPSAGNMVKRNRRILLTINTITPKMVIMPSVVGYSLRQAKAELAAKGLNIGSLYYVPDMATNNVLSQRFKGHYISSGTEIESGSYIDLEVGNSGDASTVIPEVRGMPVSIARDILFDNSLNAGRLHYDQTIKSYSDSISGFVYKQFPSPSSESYFPLGTRVELYLTTDRVKSEAKSAE